MSREVESATETKQSGAKLSKVGSVLKWLFFVELGILVVLNFFIHNHHPHFALEQITGFWAIFGLGASIILGRMAKGLAHTILGKSEDFYDV